MTGVSTEEEYNNNYDLMIAIGLSSAFWPICMPVVSIVYIVLKLGGLIKGYVMNINRRNRR